MKTQNPDKLLRISMRKHFRKKRNDRMKRQVKEAFMLSRRESRKKQRKNEPDIRRMKNILLEAKHLKRNHDRKAVRSFSQQSSVRESFLRLLTNSSAGSILAFLIIYSTFHISTILVARLFGIPIIWTQFRYHYPLGSGAAVYTRLSVILIFLTGPILALIIASRVQKQPQKHKSLFSRQLLNWIAIYGYTFFYGSVVTGILTRTETVYATSWLLKSSAYGLGDIILVILMFTLMLITGRSMTRWIATSYSDFYSKGLGYNKLISNFGLVAPWLLTVALFTGISLPYFYFPYILKLALSCFILIPIIVKLRSGYTHPVPSV